MLFTQCDDVVEEFCHGEPGAMGLSRMPMARNRRVTDPRGHLPHRERPDSCVLQRAVGARDHVRPNETPFELCGERVRYSKRVQAIIASSTTLNGRHRLLLNASPASVSRLSGGDIGP